jgi:HD-like signal output (HDOD) protein
MDLKKVLLEDVKKLPPLPKTVVELQEAYENDNFRDFIEIIKKDPILVADILRLANTPYYGFSREINDIKHAIVLFGLDQIRDFAIFSVLENSFGFDLSIYGIDEFLFLKLSHSKISLARKFFLDDKKRNSFIKNCAFLSDIGKVLIAKNAKTSLDCENFTLSKIDEIEKELFGIDTLEVTYAILKKWNFEGKFIETIKNSCDCDKGELSKILYAIRSVVRIDGEIVEPEEECVEKILMH